MIVLMTPMGWTTFFTLFDFAVLFLLKHLLHPNFLNYCYFYTILTKYKKCLNIFTISCSLWYLALYFRDVFKNKFLLLIFLSGLQICLKSIHGHIIYILCLNIHCLYKSWLSLYYWSSRNIICCTVWRIKLKLCITGQRDEIFETSRNPSLFVFRNATWLQAQHRLGARGTSMMLLAAAVDEQQSR